MIGTKTGAKSDHLAEEASQAEGFQPCAAAAPVDGLGLPLGVELDGLVGGGAPGVAGRLEDGRAVHRADGLRLDVVAVTAAGASGEGTDVVLFQAVHFARRTRDEKHAEKHGASEEKGSQHVQGDPSDVVCMHSNSILGQCNNDDAGPDSVCKLVSNLDNVSPCREGREAECNCDMISLDHGIAKKLSGNYAI